MLSEETAIGMYPVEAAGMMARIAADTDASFPTKPWRERLHQKDTLTSTQAVAQAACQLAYDVKAAALITCTYSGSTARLVSKYRPGKPILALTPVLDTYRRMALFWGVNPIMMDEIENMGDIYPSVVRFLKEKSDLKSGMKIVLTAGIPLNVTGTTNLIRVDTI